MSFLRLREFLQRIFERKYWDCYDLYVKILLLNKISIVIEIINENKIIDTMNSDFKKNIIFKFLKILHSFNYFISIIP